MWPNPQFPADMVTFTEEILNGKLHFLSSISFEVWRDCRKKAHQPSWWMNEINEAYLDLFGLTPWLTSNDFLWAFFLKRYC